MRAEPPGRRGAWALAGALSGLAALATGYLVTALVGGEESPVAAVAEQVVRLTPGGVAERAIRAVGHADKPILVTGVVVVVTVVSALVGAAARRTAGLAVPAAAYGVVAALGLAAVLAQPAPRLPGIVGTVVGYLAWVGVFALLTRPLQDGVVDGSRRAFLLGV